MTSIGQYVLKDIFNGCFKNKNCGEFRGRQPIICQNVRMEKKLGRGGERSLAPSNLISTNGKNSVERLRN